MFGRVLIETGTWRRREFGAVVRGLAGGHSVNGPQTEKLARALEAFYGGIDVHLVNSGRGALAMALRLLSERKPRRRVVLVPEYICPAVPETLAELGLEPRCVPVDRSLNVVSERTIDALNHEPLAAVPVHMYGLTIDIGHVVAAAGQRGVSVIEDAAHVAMVEGPDGQPLGSAGHFGFASFAQSKSIACGQPGAGGLLFVRDPEFRAGARSAAAQLPQAGRPGVIRYLLAGRRIAPGDERLWFLEDIMSRAFPKEPRGLSRRVTRIADIHAGLALAQVAGFQERITDKMRIAQVYASALKNIAEVEFPQYQDRYLTRVMLLARSLEERSGIRAHLARRGVATRAGYPAPAAPMIDGTAPRELPLFEVPSGFGLSEERVRRVTSSIAEFYGSGHA